MAAKFDNLDDVISKFGSTICYYDKKAVLVKTAVPHPEQLNKFQVHLSPIGGRYKLVDLDDPAFDYKNFNIGYANAGTFAAWWYRKPTKQYQQGLKKSQLGVKASPKNGVFAIEEGFTFSKPYVSMLENIYPDPGVCANILADKKMTVVGFHRDFALGWDDLHQDHVLEYRGTKIGVSINKTLTKYRLIAEARHLHEALEEALA